ncbi:MAG: hypothetical protein DRQ51_06720 [Gammaproteobacteria bacterium]|nr:MAG: hypothetical protein DRQ51_06720 [Gammaproteobacteria bacterium]
MEKYNINLGNVYTIERVDTIDKEIKLDKVPDDWPFGQYELYQGKLNWILDMHVDDKVLEWAKKMPLFQETAEFICLDLHDRNPKAKHVHSFTGTFIEALQWISKNYAFDRGYIGQVI